MTAKEMLPHLQRWADVQQHAEATWDRIEALTDYADSESPLGKAVWGIFKAYTDTLAELIGDRDGWLDWYHLENAMGRNAMKAGSGPGARPRSIRRLIDLAWIISATTSPAS